MVNIAADLAQFVQRRELLAYEQRVARAAYAYGVDLRRAAWLDHSTMGEPLMRSVDRKWGELVQGLSSEVLEPAERAAPDEVLEELSQLLRLLRAPLPTLRLLRQSASKDDWPIATPLGTTRGGTHWIVLDVPRLMAIPATARTYLLGAALGNLQCDHGPMFAAHLMAHRGRGFSMLRSLFKPWSRVSVFSADRAGLLAVGDLADALEAMQQHANPEVPWLPPLPPIALRRQALEDFDRSRVMTRLRLLFPHRGEWTVAPSQTELDPKKPQRGGAREGGEGGEDGPADDAASSTEAKTGPPPVPDGKAEGMADKAEEPKPGPKLVEDVVEEAEREAEKIESERAAAESQQDAEAADKETAEEIQSAWPLARCDARLTRRLGLL